jgi:hypothetical protein
MFMKVLFLSASILFVGCSNGSNSYIPDNFGNTDTDEGEFITPPLSKCVSVSELLELAERIRSALPKALVRFEADYPSDLLCACPVPDTPVPVEEVPVEEVPDTTVPVEEVPVEEVPDTTVPVVEVPVEEEGVCPAGVVPRPSWYTGKF